MDPRPLEPRPAVVEGAVAIAGAVPGVTAGAAATVPGAGAGALTVGAGAGAAPLLSATNVEVALFTDRPAAIGSLFHLVRLSHSKKPSAMLGMVSTNALRDTTMGKQAGWSTLLVEEGDPQRSVPAHLHP